MTIVLATLVAACFPSQPEPRSFFVFMEDGLAREGALARCNQDRNATANDVECINARRAAAVIALEQEQTRRAELELESQRKLIALRDQAAREALAAQAAAEAARAAAQLAYERQWPKPPAAGEAGRSSQGTQPTPSFGAPLGPVMPSMSQESVLEPSVDAEPIGDSQTTVAEAPPVTNAAPVEPLGAAVESTSIPRPFRTNDETVIRE